MNYSNPMDAVGRLKALPRSYSSTATKQDDREDFTELMRVASVRMLMEKLDDEVSSHRLQILCSSSHSNFKDEDEVDKSKAYPHKAIWIEKYSNGTTKRYEVDDKSKLLTITVEEDRPTANSFPDFKDPSIDFSLINQLLDFKLVVSGA
ncbi:hypothetical protein K1719_026618 [Acacia pycnantha]|nr:hypothetical protein K1719_026618 [Acacia pycnantha]